MKQYIDNYLHNHCIEIIQSDTAPDSTLIITPDLMNALGRHIPTHYGDIIFVNFEGLHLHNDINVRGNIWIVDSTILTLDKLNCWGEIHFIRTDLSPESRMQVPERPIFMDGESFLTYLKNRKTNRNITNNSLVVLEDDELNKRLENSLEHTIKIDLPSYLIATHDGISLKETDRGIIVEGNKILLSGPYHYDFSDICEIKSDIEIHDNLRQSFGKTKLGGQIAVVNRY